MRKLHHRTGKRLLAAVAAVIIAFTSLTVPAEAATNKALSISYSFNGQNFEKNGETCGYNNTYTAVMYGTSKKTALKNLKIGAQVYIPKKTLAKNNATVDISPYLDVIGTKDKYVGWLGGRISVSVVREGKKVNVYAWDEVKQKNVKASTYATCKAGTGAYKSYYVVTLKNIGHVGKIDLDGTMTKIKSTTKYAVNVGINITGENIKGSGKLYLDNVKVSSGKKTVVNHTFSSKPDFYEVFNKDKLISKKKFSIVKF